MSTDTTPLTAAELDDLVRRTRAPGGLVHGFEIRRLVAMARRGAEIETIALKFRDTATDTYSVVCALGESKPCRYHKCDYHNMRDAEAQFDAALAEVNGTPTQEAPNDGS